MVVGSYYHRALIVGAADYPDTVLGCGTLYLYALLDASKVFVKKAVYVIMNPRYEKTGALKGH